MTQKERELMSALARYAYSPSPQLAKDVETLHCEIKSAAVKENLTTDAQDGQGEPCDCKWKGIGLHAFDCPHNTPLPAPHPDPCAERARAALVEADSILSLLVNREPASVNWELIGGIDRARACYLECRRAYERK